MIQHAIAVLFQINEITPIKACWVAITLANVVMMLWLARKLWPHTLIEDGYFLNVAACTLLQGSAFWKLPGELWIAVWTAAWVLFMLPRERHGRIFALSIGIVATFALMLAVPPPWRGYPPDLYFTRLYSTAAFLGIAFGSALLTRNPSTMLAVPWFGAVMLASSQRGFDRWAVGIYTNLTWTACLICWLALARRADDRAASSTPDAPDVHPRSARSLL